MQESQQISGVNSGSGGQEQLLQSLTLSMVRICPIKA